MPIVKIYGMPEGRVVGDHLVSLIERIQAATAAISELKISPNQVSVFFPRDLVRQDLGEELIAEVTGLVSRPERTSEVKQRLLDAIRDVLASFARVYIQKVQQCKLVEVFLIPFEHCSTSELDPT